MKGFSLGIEEIQPEVAVFFGDDFMKLHTSLRGTYPDHICLGNFWGFEEANVFRNFVEWWECYTPISIAEMEEEVTT